MMSDNPFEPLVADTRLQLPGTARFTTAGHLLSHDEIYALTFAYAARRPLLVRGEAGSGKSQLARAAACILGRAEGVERDRWGELLHAETIHARYEAQDLLYKVDHVERLADAQMQRLAVDNERYVTKGKLWQAFLDLQQGRSPVLLIDEIDKADADLPNALLEVLGNRSFTVPMLKDRTVSVDGRLPLIIVTTNEERELPPAFVRRCAVLNLNPPEHTREAFMDWLVRRGHTHEQLLIVKDDLDFRAAQQREQSAHSEEQSAVPHAPQALSVLDQIAAEVWEDRLAAVRAGFSRVGLAEFIDLLNALDELTRSLESTSERRARQLEWLGKLKRYALVKGAGQPQRPGSASPAALQSR